MAQATHASTHQEVLKDVPSAQPSFPTLPPGNKLVFFLLKNLFLSRAHPSVLMAPAQKGSDPWFTFLLLSRAVSVLQ